MLVASAGSEVSEGVLNKEGSWNIWGAQFAQKGRAVYMMGKPLKNSGHCNALKADGSVARLDIDNMTREQREEAFLP